MKLSDFLALVDDYEGPDAKGDYVAICPAHSDGSPSLLVGQAGPGQRIPEGSLYVHCRAGCEKGKVLKALGLSMSDLFSKDKKVDTSAPVSRSTINQEGPGPEDIAALRAYVKLTTDRLIEDKSEHADRARAYIVERFGISVDEAAALNLGFDPGGAWYDGPLEFGPTYLQVPRVVFPFFDFDGVVKGLQGRALIETKVRWSGPINPDGKAFSKFSVYDRSTGLDTIVLTEGPGDAITAAGAGFDSLAIRGATLVQNEKLRAELIAGLSGRRIVLAGDDDDAGRNYNSALAQVFEEAGLTVFTLPWRTAPPGATDVTAWQEAAGKTFTSDFQKAVDRAESPGKDTTADAPDEERFTEVGMARRLRDRLALDGHNGVRFANGMGFYLWTGKHWKHDLSGHILRREAQVMVEELHDEAEEALARGNISGDTEKAWKAQRSAAVRFESSLLLGGIIREMEAMVYVERDAMNAHHHLLNVANGTVDLRDGTIKPHDRQDLITHYIPIPYKPGAKCERWERFLTEIFPTDPAMPAYLRRLIGYGITGETVEQAFAVLWGTGANGKSVLTDTLTEVFRDIATTTPFSTFEQKPNGGIPNDVAALNGARLVFAAEGEQGKLMAESVIKRVTGSDLISARFMRQEFFEFRPTFLILLATNHKPRFKGQDEGLWRRVKMLPFSRYFKPSERDHKLTRTLKDEYEGILAWAVAGAIEWYAADGLGEPESITQATDTYRDAADGLLGFVDLYIVPEQGGKVRAKDVFERFKEHLIAEGVKESDIWSPRAFYSALEERGYGRKQVRIAGKVEWALLGMHLLTEEEAAARLSDDLDTLHVEHPVGNPVQ